MIQLSKSGGTVTFTFDENSGYLQNGTIDVPVNSLSLILDESNMATFRKSASNDIFVSALVGDFGMSKSELEAWYKENMVGSTGGGVDSGTVQTMIDEAVSGKIDSSSAVTDVKVLTVSAQNELQIEEHKGGSTASTFVGTVYRVGSGLTWNYQTKEFAVDSSTIATKTDLASKQDTLVEGRAIDITNNTVSLDLPISAGTGSESVKTGYSGNTASGVRSVAMGEATTASGYASVAEGMNTVAGGSCAHAEGQYTEAKNWGEHACGIANVSNSGSTDADKTLFSVGNGSNPNNRHNAFEVRRNGDIYLSLNGQDVKLQDQLGGSASYSAGTNIDITNDTISCTLPLTITGSDSTSLKNKGTIQQSTSFAYGNNLNIRGTDYNSSAAFGDSNTTYGQNSFICGRHNNISNLAGFGFACGDYNTVGYYCVAGFVEGGYNNIDNGARYAHAEGYYTTAKGYYSHTEGYGTKTKNQSEHASGQFNVSSSASTTFGDSGNTLFSVGNGTSSASTHNAFEIRQNGDIYLTKDGVDIKLQDNLGGGTASSAITSGDTNAVAGGAVYDKFDEVEQVTAAALNQLSEGQEVAARALNDLNDKFGGLKLQKITQAAYDALSGNTDSNTLYVIVN